jgi:hypothetical protein
MTGITVAGAGVTGARDTGGAVMEAAMWVMAAGAEKIAPLWLPCRLKLVWQQG